MKFILAFLGFAIDFLARPLFAWFCALAVCFFLLAVIMQLTGLRR